MLTKLRNVKASLFRQEYPGVNVLDGHSGSIRCCDISTDGLYGASGSGDHSVIVWDLRKKCSLHVFGANSKATAHTHIVTAVSFSPCGTFLVSASWDHTIRVWDVKQGCLRANIQAHEQVISCCIWLPNGSGILSGGSDGTLRLWRLYEDGQCDDLSKFTWGSSGLVEYAFKFSGAGFHEDLSTEHAARYREITGKKRHVCERSKCSVVSVLPFEEGGSVVACGSSTDSRRVALVSGCGELVLVDADLMAAGSYKAATTLRVTKACQTAASVSWAEGTDLLAIGARDVNVQVRSAATGDLLVELEVRGLFAAFLRGPALASCLVVSGSQGSKAMHVWRVGAPGCKLLQVSSKATTAVACRASGQFMAGSDNATVLYLEDLGPNVAKVLHTTKKKRLKKSRSSEEAERGSTNPTLSDTSSGSSTINSDATVSSEVDVERLRSGLREQQAINAQLQAAISKLSERMVQYESSAGSLGAGPASPEEPAASPATTNPLFRQSSNLSAGTHSEGTVCSLAPLLGRHQSARSEATSAGNTPGSLDGATPLPRFLEPDALMAPPLCTAPTAPASPPKAGPLPWSPPALEAESSMAPDLCAPAGADGNDSPVAATRAPVLNNGGLLAGDNGGAGGDNGGGGMGSGARNRPREAKAQGVLGGGGLPAPPRVPSGAGVGGTPVGRAGGAGGVQVLSGGPAECGGSTVCGGAGAAGQGGGEDEGGLGRTASGHLVVLSGGSVLAEGEGGGAGEVHRGERGDRATCMSIHPAGGVVAVGSQRCMRLWSSETQSAIKMLGLGLVGKGVEALEFSSSGRWLACVAAKETAKVLLWDWAQGSLVCMKAAYPKPGGVRCLKFCPQDETRFVTGGRQHFKVWRVRVDPRSIEGIADASTEDHLELRARRGLFCAGAMPEEVTCAAYGRGGMLYLGTEGGVVLVCCEHLALRAVEAHRGGVTAMLPAASGQLYSGGADGCVREWQEFEAAGEGRKEEAGGGPVVALAFGAAGRVLMLAKSHGARVLRTGLQHRAVGDGDTGATGETAGGAAARGDTRDSGLC